MTIFIENKLARQFFLHQHCLTQKPGVACTKADILKTVQTLGFVQVDSIRTVERAHHLILFSRHQTFKHEMLRELLEDDRSLFENWTHDASIIASDFYCFWKHRFQREKKEMTARWEKWGRKGFVEQSDEVVAHIRQHGPTLSRDLKRPSPDKKSSSGWWDWHPSKAALEYLWRTGTTAISHRTGFQKSYDLAQNVIPPEHFEKKVSATEYSDWACSSALERLGFATHSEIAAFWGLIKPATAKQWIEKFSSDLVEVEVQSFDKSSTKLMWARHDLKERLTQIPEVPPRIRVLSPFDPMIRDRKRTEFLFGFHYRIEVFVPEVKREYGYYVFPLLQGERLIGRIDMKADRKNETLNVRRVWLEKKIRWSAARRDALTAELHRIRRFSKLSNLHFDPEAFCGDKGNFDE